MKKTLKGALSARFPLMRDILVERYVDKYIGAVMPEIAAQYMRMTSEDVCAGEMSFATDRVSNACGRLDIDRRTKYIYQVMQQHSSTSLVIEICKGNSMTHRVSRVVFNPQFKKEIMEALQSLTVELNPERLHALEEQANVFPIVDPASLASFITQTGRTLGHHGKGAKYEDKLTRSLVIANALQGRIKSLPDNRHYVSEYWEEIDSGRIYGHGLSLQRIPREVRHAMLGECHKYDFKASSYALMTSLAVQIDPTLKVGALTEYIAQRSFIRKRIAKDVGISEEWAKSVFTSLGFGAELKDNPYNAIRSKLGQNKYSILICNEEFSMIAKQLKAVNKVINAAFPNGGFVFYGREYRPLDPKTGSKRTKNQKLAWIYQCLESEALKQFIDLAGVDPLLAAHDCLYFEQQLPASKTADIAYRLSQQFNLLRFEHEKVMPIHAVEDHGKRDREIEDQVRAHKRNIAEHERQAASYRSMRIDDSTQPKRMAQTPWGEIEAEIWEQVAPVVRHGAH